MLEQNKRLIKIIDTEYAKNLNFCCAHKFRELMDTVLVLSCETLRVKDLINKDETPTTVSGYLKFLCDGLEGVNKESAVYKHRRAVKNKLVVLYS